MSNSNAGENLQLAITEGRAKQCTAHKSNGEQCKNVARDGYNVCWKHGAGSGKREIEGIRKRPGRPIETGLYSRVLPIDLKDTYNEVFGDLTLVHEVALAKTILLKFLRKLETEENETTNVEEILSPFHQENRRKQMKDDIYYLIKMIETVNKTTTAAFDQLQDKKIVVTIENNQSEIIDMVRTAVEQEIVFMNKIICPECRNRLADALFERQKTILG